MVDDLRDAVMGNRPIPMTSHTTCSAGSFRRRTDAVPVAANAAPIHCGSSAALNWSNLAGRSAAPSASKASPTPIVPTSVGETSYYRVRKRSRTRSLTR